MLESRTALDGTTWDVVSELIRTRRSNLNVDQERPVPRDVIDQLLGLAVTAPNHYRTNPWRFVVLTGNARARLGNVVADILAQRPDAKEAVVERQRVQFLRAPTVLVIAAAADADPAKHLENKHAVAAGVENILLGATAAGLASAWRSGAPMIDPEVTAAVKEEIGLEPTDEIVSFVYLGYPIAPPGTRQVPQPHVSYLES